MLNFGAGEFKPDKFPAFGMKLSRSAEHVGLVLPFFLATAHDNASRRYQFFQSFGIAREPRAPDSFAHMQQFVVTLVLSA